MIKRKLLRICSFLLKNKTGLKDKEGIMKKNIIMNNTEMDRKDTKTTTINRETGRKDRTIRIKTIIVDNTEGIGTTSKNRNKKDNPRNKRDPTFRLYSRVLKLRNGWVKLIKCYLEDKNKVSRLVRKKRRE